MYISGSGLHKCGSTQASSPLGIDQDSTCLEHCVVVDLVVISVLDQLAFRIKKAIKIFGHGKTNMGTTSPGLTGSSGAEGSHVSSSSVRKPISVDKRHRALIDLQSAHFPADQSSSNIVRKLNFLRLKET